MIRKPSLSFIKPLKNLSGKEFSYYVFTALITMFLMAFYTGFMVYSKKLDRSTLITNDLVYLIASSITGILVMPVMEKIIPWYFDKPF